MAFSNDAGLKCHPVIESPEGGMENPHTVIRHILIQAEIDRFTHSLEMVFDNTLVERFATNDKILTGNDYPVNTKKQANRSRRRRPQS